MDTVRQRVRLALAATLLVVAGGYASAQVCRDSTPVGTCNTKQAQVVCDTQALCTCDGGNWVCTAGGSGGTPGGAEETVQRKSGGVFAGDDGFTYDASTDSPRVLGEMRFGSAGSDTCVKRNSDDQLWEDSNCNGTMDAGEFTAIRSRVYNVKDWGALGNGTADDTVPIQLAVNAAIAAEGGRVYLPAGLYKVTAPIEIDWGFAAEQGDVYPRIGEIYGDGVGTLITPGEYGATTILATNMAASRGIIEATGESNGEAAKLAIRDLQIRGVGPLAGGSVHETSYGLILGDAVQALVERVQIFGANGIGLKISSSASYAQIGTTFRQVYVWTNYRDEWYTLANRASVQMRALEPISGGANWDTVRFESCVFYGQVLTRAENVTFDNCLFSTPPDRANGYGDAFVTTCGNAVISSSYFEEYRSGVVVAGNICPVPRVTIASTYFSGTVNLTSTLKTYTGVLVSDGLYGVGVVHIDKPVFLTQLEGAAYQFDSGGEIVLTGVSNLVGPIAHQQPDGVNTVSAQGTYSGAIAPDVFLVKLTNSGTNPQKFQWRRESGGAYSADVTITAAAWQTLSDGVQVKFDSATGYTLNHTWTIPVGLGGAKHVQIDYPVYRVKGGQFDLNSKIRVQDFLARTNSATGNPALYSRNSYEIRWPDGSVESVGLFGRSTTYTSKAVTSQHATLCPTCVPGTSPGIALQNQRADNVTGEPHAHMSVSWYGSEATALGNFAAIEGGATSHNTVARSEGGQLDFLTKTSADTELQSRMLIRDDGDVELLRSLRASNLGIDFAESDTNPGCAAGDFRVYADDSENKLKICQEGVASDIGGGGTIVGADTEVLFFDGADSPKGDAGLLYNKTTDTLTVLGGAVVGAGSGSPKITISTDETTDPKIEWQDSTDSLVIRTNSTSVVLSDTTGEIYYSATRMSLGTQAAALEDERVTIPQSSSDVWGVGIWKLSSTVGPSASIAFGGLDSTPVPTTYAGIGSSILVNTNGSEAGALDLYYGFHDANVLGAQLSSAGLDLTLPLADAEIASTIARDSEVPGLETDPGVPLVALADHGNLCAGGEVVRRNAGDSANECYTPAATLADGDKTDITVSASGATFTIDPGVVTRAKISDGLARTVIGRSANTTGVTADIAGAGANTFLSDDGSTLAFRQPAFSNLSGSATDAQIPDAITVDLATLATTATTANAGDSATAFFSAGVVEFARGGTGAAPGAGDQLLVSDSTSAGTWRTLTDCDAATSAVTYDVTTNAFACNTISTALADDAVTFAKLQEIATDRLIGRDTAATGNPEEISVGGGLEFTGAGGIQRSALTGDVTATAGSNTTAIAAGVILDADVNASAAIAATKLDPTLIVGTEIDTSSELAAILTDEAPGSGGFVRGTQPTLTDFVTIDRAASEPAIVLARAGTNRTQMRLRGDGTPADPWRWCVTSADGATEWNCSSAVGTEFVGRKLLSHHVVSGSGTSGTPYVLDTANWNEVKGNTIIVKKDEWFKIDWADVGLDLSTNTRILCEPGGTFVWPATTRSSSTGMFKVAPTATNVVIEGCTFEPGYVVGMGGSATDLCGPYIDVGTAGTAGQPNFRFSHLTFKKARVVNNGTAMFCGFHIGLWSGSYDSVIEDSYFDYGKNGIFAESGNTTQQYTHDNLTIKDNIFDYWDYDNAVWGGVDYSIVLGDGGGDTFHTQFRLLKITGNKFYRVDDSIRVSWKGSSLDISGNQTNSRFIDPFMRVEPLSGDRANYVTIVGNSCSSEYLNPLDTTGASATCTSGTLCDWGATQCAADLNLITHLTMVGNQLQGGGTSVSLNDVDDAFISANKIGNDNNPVSAGVPCLEIEASGSSDRVTFANNTCYDSSELVHIPAGQTPDDLHIVDNRSVFSDTLSAGTNIRLGVVFADATAGCDDCVATGNKVQNGNYCYGLTGACTDCALWAQQGTTCATDRAATFDYLVDNHWSTDYSADPWSNYGPVKLRTAAGGSTTIQRVSTSTSDTTFTLPTYTTTMPAAEPRDGQAMVAANAGGQIVYEPLALVADAYGPYYFSASNTGDWTALGSPANANDTDESTVAFFTDVSDSLAVKVHDWTFPSSITASGTVQVLWRMNGGNCMTSPGALARVLYDVAGGTPATLLASVTTPSTGWRLSSVALTSQLLSNLKIRAEFTGSDDTSPAGATCKMEVASIRFSLATMAATDRVQAAYIYPAGYTTMNAQCTASSTPFNCCTGSGTGTCTDFANEANVRNTDPDSATYSTASETTERFGVWNWDGGANDTAIVNATLEVQWNIAGAAVACGPIPGTVTYCTSGTTCTPSTALDSDTGPDPATSRFASAELTDVKLENIRVKVGITGNGGADCQLRVLSLRVVPGRRPSGESGELALTKVSVSGNVTAATSVVAGTSASAGTTLAAGDGLTLGGGIVLNNDHGTQASGDAKIVLKGTGAGATRRSGSIEWRYATTDVLACDAFATTSGEVVFADFDQGVQSAPANSSCTGSGAPMTCCTGSGTGTCDRARIDCNDGATYLPSLSLGAASIRLSGTSGPLWQYTTTNATTGCTPGEVRFDPDGNSTSGDCISFVCNNASQWQCLAGFEHRIPVLDDSVDTDDADVTRIRYDTVSTNLKWKHRVWQFAATSARDCLYGVFTIPHLAHGADGIRGNNHGALIVSWNSSSAGGGNVVWDWEVLPTTTTLDAAAATETVTATTAAPGTAHNRTQTTLTLVGSALVEIDGDRTAEWMLCRDQTDAADTLAAPVFVHDVQYSYGQ